MSSSTFRERVVQVLIGGTAVVLAVAFFLRHGNLVSWRLASRVRQGEGTVVDLVELAHFPWDRVYVFPPYTPQGRIHDFLGFHWPAASRTYIQNADDINLVIFVKDQKVTHWFEHPRSRGDLVESANTTGYAPHEARFRVGIDEHQRAVLRLLNPPPPEPDPVPEEPLTP
jgi:hypothetical protein